MTTKDIVGMLKDVKAKFDTVRSIYVFWSTAKFTRKAKSDIDLIVIANNWIDDMYALRRSLYNLIKEKTWLNSDIKIWLNFEDIKRSCYNDSIFTNLIKI